MADHIVSQHLFPFQTNQIYNHKEEKEAIISLIVGPNKEVWLRALSNKLGWYLRESIMVSNLLTPSTSFLDLQFQLIAVSLMRHFYATISHLKVNRIIYVVFPVEANFIIQTIQDHQMLPSLKLNLL